MNGSVLRRILAGSAMLLITALPVHAGPGAGFSVFGNEGGFLGVSVQDVTDELREALGIDASDGVLVNRVIEDSPAEKAGIEVGDVLHGIDGTALTSARKLSRLVGAMEPGHEVRIELTRDGKKRTLVAEIGERPDRAPGIARVAIGHEPGPWLGVRLHDLDEDLAAYFRAEPDRGALVLGVEKESPAAEAGLRSGDVILRIDGENVGNSADVTEAIGEREAGDDIAVRVLRKGKEEEFDVTLADSPGMRWFQKAGRYGLPSFEGLPHVDLRSAPFRKGDWSDEMDALKEELADLRKELEKLKRGK